VGISNPVLDEKRESMHSIRTFNSILVSVLSINPRWAGIRKLRLFISTLVEGGELSAAVWARPTEREEPKLALDYPLMSELHGLVLVMYMSEIEKHY
jgi:hypothetical protein